MLFEVRYLLEVLGYSQLLRHTYSIPTSSHVVATTTLVAIDRTNCVCCTSRGPREVQNCGRLLPKLNAHAQNVLGATQHCFAPLDPSRGQQEEPHTQFARRMETKVVVATMWLSVGIDSMHHFV